MEADLIYDVGAFRGEDTGFYLAKGFRVVAVEANPALVAQLESRFAAPLADGRLRLVAAAISERAGPARFYVNDLHPVWSTTSPEWVARNLRRGTPSREITVPGATFGSLLRQHGVPYYLKIDIEGADLLCLQALREERSRPRYVSLESSMTSWHDLLAEFRLLRELGYRRFQIVNQLLVPRQRPPAPAREGGYVEQVFDRDATGLFGAELPGRWLTARQAIRRYRRIFLEYRLFGNDGIVSTLDWKRPLLRRFKFLLPERKWHDTHASL
jgi:FkbM family methyltransferase